MQAQRRHQTGCGVALQRAESVGVKLLQLRGLSYQHIVLGGGEGEWSQRVSGCSRDDLRVVTHCPNWGWQSLSIWQEVRGECAEEQAK